LDEVDEAIRVMDSVAQHLRNKKIDVKTFTDTVSTSQDENLRRITDWHNSIPCALACSIHFNAYQVTDKPMGTECLWVTQEDLAEEVSSAIADAGDFIDRGPKKRSDLYFLNNTAAPAILIETCFVDSKSDAALYHQNFDIICRAIAATITGEDIEEPEQQPESGGRFYARGTCSWFGGPEDDGVSPAEGLAFFYKPEECPHLMLPEQPPGTTGMARRLDADRVFYVACRWPYDAGVPKDMLRNQNLKALVRGNKREFYAFPADWGPHEAETGRAADLSLALMRALFDSDDATDEIVEVIYPAPR
jgi:N-acetylmuramoyl-L-alanine amidase